MFLDWHVGGLNKTLQTFLESNGAGWSEPNGLSHVTLQYLG